ncbi:MAG: sigma-70 family RNA polymerase sigma factor [Planctomycetaceae bacterium]|nr:sigma-70 family RNA polymerase sigma factor [Planctomycetaceae bacterium]
MSDVTQILSQIESGDSAASEQLLPLVYEELRKLAATRMAMERGDHTLQATALVHEAYLRLVNGSSPQNWNTRGHFFSAAAEAMRRILVESARRKQRLKSCGDRKRQSLNDVSVPELTDEGLLEIDDALSVLAAEDLQAAKAVELRYFGGLGHEEIAEALGITVYQARQKWTYARAWLRERLRLSERK